MGSTIESLSVSKGRLRTGYALSGLAILFLLFDCGIKVVKAAPAVEGTVQLGYPENLVVVIGVIELLCLILYALPRTAVAGAILLTGFLGGAIASQLRIGAPLFSNTLFPLYVAALVWGGLFLRDRRAAAFILQRA
jgi:hypothetical protein